MPPGRPRSRLAAAALATAGAVESRFLSDAALACLRKLSKDPYCCVDEVADASVVITKVRREGTEWTCEAERGCVDSLLGLRGEDSLFVPPGASCRTPRILYVHGGAWQWSSPGTDGYGVFGTKLAARTGAVVMMHDYPLVPVGNFSTIVGSTLLALRWLGERIHEAPSFAGWSGEACGDEPPPLFLAGDSAGGGTALSAVLQHRTLRKHEPASMPPLAGAFFFSPWTNLACDSPDYYHNAAWRSNEDEEATRILTGDLIFPGKPREATAMWRNQSRMYLGSPEHGALPVDDPLPSPYHATKSQLCHGGPLPPLFFAVGGAEVLLGDSTVVAQRAAACAGHHSDSGDVWLDIFPGMWHVFPTYAEGCGSGVELWPAHRALNVTAAFVAAAAAGQLRSDAELKWPRTAFVYDHGQKTPGNDHIVIPDTDNVIPDSGDVIPESSAVAKDREVCSELCRNLMFGFVGALMGGIFMCGAYQWLLIRKQQQYVPDQKYKEGLQPKEHAQQEGPELELSSMQA